jgi:hypothetical protein
MMKQRNGDARLEKFRTMKNADLVRFSIEFITRLIVIVLAFIMRQHRSLTESREERLRTQRGAHQYLTRD